MSKLYETEVAIVGGGIAGIATALELLNKGIDCLILDRDTADRFGGLARDAFGGMALCGTPLQKLNRIPDSPELLLRDWLSFADFGAEDIWPRQWAEMYAERNNPDVYQWLVSQGVKFFPAVNWVERGDYVPGNSVPRYHIVWGTGWELAEVLIARLRSHANAGRARVEFQHFVKDFITTDGAVTGCQGINEATGEAFEVRAGTVVVATGGINGNLEKIREHWPEGWQEPPEVILNGSHQYSDGWLHDRISEQGANITHLEWQWNYAAGIHHPKPRMPLHGLSLIPPKSALWMDCRGNRIGPRPMVTGFDTNKLCERVCEQEKGYTWQVLNKKIARKEISISGSEHNPSFRDKKAVKFLKEILLGNDDLYHYMTEECPDVVVAYSIPELVEKMNAVTGDNLVTVENMTRDIKAYDAQIDRGPTFHDDEQLRLIEHARRWKGDKIRTCKYQKIDDERAYPLVAIREFLISRKSMGGIQTDLYSRVLDTSGNVMKNLYAVGEAAGFGGGGVCGRRALEGTFLSLCILSGRIAGRHLAGEAAP
ncbi:MAG: FAD-binding dehydrogenase [Ketobacteraceae bacterium]|nr:FAD-binding dehydrogenase [Ketobacteraceae bacterium]